MEWKWNQDGNKFCPVYRADIESEMVWIKKTNNNNNNQKKAKQ